MDWLEILTDVTQRIKAEVTFPFRNPITKKTYGIGAGGDPEHA